MQQSRKSLKLESAGDFEAYLDQALYLYSHSHPATESQICSVEKRISPASLHQIKQEYNIKHQSSEKTINELTSVNESDIQLRNANDIVKAGFLFRKAASFIKKWMKCYCVLTHSKFLCYEDFTRTTLISCLNFRKVNAFTKTADDGTNTFDLIWDDETVATFMTESHQETQLWVREIQEIIKSFLNTPKLRIRKVSRNLYRDEDTLTQQELFQIAQSGDILLMKTDDSKCALQRLVTNSDYDHISMVVKFSDNDVKIFEANADQGVKIYDWNEFHYKFNHYEKICYRKLYHMLEEQLHKLLLTFIKDNIGRKYCFSAMKMFRKNSSEEGAEEKTEFFCSELVAKAYKHLKLLTTSKGSNTYWPVDFTIRGAMNLEKGSYLGIERVILLKKHLNNAQ